MPLKEALAEIRARLMASKANDVDVLVQATHRSIVVTLLHEIERRSGTPGRVYRDIEEIVAQVPAMVELVMSDPSLLANLMYNKGLVTCKSTWPIRALLWGTSDHLSKASSANDEQRRLMDMFKGTIWTCATNTLLQRVPMRSSKTNAILRPAFVAKRDTGGSVVGWVVDAGVARSPMHGGVELRFDEYGRDVVTGVDPASAMQWYMRGVPVGPTQEQQQQQQTLLPLSPSPASASVMQAPLPVTPADAKLFAAYVRYSRDVKEVCMTLWVLAAVLNFGRQESKKRGGARAAAAAAVIELVRHGSAAADGRWRVSVSSATARAIVHAAFFFAQDSEATMQFIAMSAWGEPSLVRARLESASYALFPKRDGDRGQLGAIERAVTEVKNRIFLLAGQSGDPTTAGGFECLGHVLAFSSLTLVPNGHGNEWSPLWNIVPGTEALLLKRQQLPPPAADTTKPRPTNHHHDRDRYLVAERAPSWSSSSSEQRGQDYYHHPHHHRNQQQQQQHHRRTSSQQGHKHGGTGPDAGNRGFRR